MVALSLCLASYKRDYLAAFSERRQNDIASMWFVGKVVLGSAMDAYLVFDGALKDEFDRCGSRWFCADYRKALSAGRNALRIKMLAEYARRMNFSRTSRDTLLIEG